MLSTRLETLISMIHPTSALADVGCDHGLLACEVKKRQIAQVVYAMDINQKPLDQAKETIIRYQLEEAVFPILSNGLDKLSKEVKTVLIAGVGYETCKMILENDLDKLGQLDQIIIQINRDVDKLRLWIVEHHMAILDEKMIYDKHFYQALSICPKQSQSLSLQQIKYGPILMQEKSDIFIKYLEHQKNKLNKALSNLDKTHPKAILIQEEIKEIDQLFNKAA
ncbi:MAG: class I SAM-dependent methyltransferase [Erysipelotrichaceae bacterium]